MVILTMSDTEEHRSLLANADNDSEFDYDQAIAMQQMMGFSSFGGTQKPKRQPRGPGTGKGFGTGANTQPIQPRTPSTTTTVSTTKSSLSAVSHPFVPASVLPRPQKQPRLNPKTHSEAPTDDASYFQTAMPLQATALPNTRTTMVTGAPSNLSLNPASPPFTTSWQASTSANSASSPLNNLMLPQHTLTSTSNSVFPSPPTSVITTTTNQANLDEVAYTNPNTNISLTRRELQAYEHGVLETTTNNDGSTTQVKVYFKPNFIDDDPWAGMY